MSPRPVAAATPASGGPIAGPVKFPAAEIFTNASYQDAQRIWGDFKKSMPDFKKQVTEAGPAVAIDPSLTRPVDASRFRSDLTLTQYQELRSDLLLQMRLHPEQANALSALSKLSLGKLPQAYQQNFSTFVGNERVSGMQQGALEWQRQLVTKQSSGDPEHPSLYRLTRAHRLFRLPVDGGRQEQAGLPPLRPRRGNCSRSPSILFLAPGNR